MSLDMTKQKPREISMKKFCSGRDTNQVHHKNILRDQPEELLNIVLK
jgi:hypothetical protein